MVWIQPPDYYEQLTAEERIETFSRGRPVTKWQLKVGRKRNEALDLRVYNLAMLEMLGEIDWHAVRNSGRQNENADERTRTGAKSRRKRGFTHSWRRGI